MATYLILYTFPDDQSGSDYKPQAGSATEDDDKTKHSEDNMVGKGKTKKGMRIGGSRVDITLARQTPAVTAFTVPAVLPPKAQAKTAR